MKLLQKAKEKNPQIDEKLVKKAYKYAKEKHGEQRRASGEYFYTHPYNTAIIVCDFYCETETICAALLHDVVEDTSASLSDIEKTFGKKIAFYVDALTEDKKVRNWQDRRKAFHKKILSSGKKDKKVFYIKFADILHNVKTINTRGEMRTKRYTKEINDFYVPLAEKLKEKKLAEKLIQKSNQVIRKL